MASTPAAPPGTTTSSAATTTSITGGGSVDDLIATGSHSTLIQAASGNETLDGSLSTGNNTYRAGSGKDEIVGGFGNDTFVGGTGTSTMQGGSGKDVFQFIAGDASKSLIVDFSTINGDQINLSGYGANEVNFALAHEKVSGASTTISLTDSTKITFSNVTDITKSSFS